MMSKENDEIVLTRDVNKVAANKKKNSQSNGDSKPLPESPPKQTPQYRNSTEKHSIDSKTPIPVSID